MADVTQALSIIAAHALITHPASFTGTAVDILGDIGAMVYIHHANIETTANDTGVRYKIRGTPNNSSDEDWFTMDEIVTGTVAAVTEDLTATEPIGETVLACASTTGFTADEYIYIIDTTTLAASEWAEVERIVSNTSVDILDGLTTQKDSSDDLWDQAERHLVYVDLTGVRDLSCVVNHQASTGSDIHFKVEALRFTDFE